MAGWLYNEINVRHRELNPDTVAHLSTNRARRRLTSLIEANALTITPDHQKVRLKSHFAYADKENGQTFGALPQVPNKLRLFARLFYKTKEIQEAL